jgi:hypothetical protein
MQSMNQKYPYGIGPFGRAIIFWGAAMFFLLLAGIRHDLLTRAFGPKLDSYVLLGIATVLWIVSSLLFDRISKKLSLLIGVIGWLPTFSLAFYWYCFGPGAFGHQHQ